MDAIFASSNEWGVPDLIAPPRTNVAPALLAPFGAWGSVCRRRDFTGTWHFYVDDYRFAGLMADPLQPLRTGAGALGEANFSVFDECPRAVALWRIYQKRWITRSWQEARPELPIWIDLCVAGAHSDLALLGVPPGWQRFATAGWDRHVWELDRELERAVAWSAGAPFSLLVYGGGAEVTSWCAGRANIIRVPHRRAHDQRPGEGSRRRVSAGATAASPTPLGVFREDRSVSHTSDMLPIVHIEKA